MIRVNGYELILGSSQDPQFDPVLLFGTGGQLVEVFQDNAIALVAEVSTPDPKIIGVCRLTQKHELLEAEFAMLVADPYQGKGFGTELLRRRLRCDW